MIEAITFDFWNTIARAPAGMMTEARQRAVLAACAAAEVEVEEAFLLNSLEQVALSYERSWSAGTHFHPRTGAEMLVGAIGVEGAVAEAVADAFLTAGKDAKLEFSPGIRAALEDLAARGIRLGIVCDVGFTGGELLRGLLAEAGLLDRFSGWAFSDEVGHYKPSPQIFEAALRSLGATPATAMHVGDLRRTDIAGAAALGMRTVRYRALHDDPGSAGEIEADFVLDDHLELPGLLDRIEGRSL
ncbi:MAG TPA: HAD family hydrolase [Solirubrobacterales bacterium]|nr:HAD family hydrolase [Solirubrobacterales bacterium]